MSVALLDDEWDDPNETECPPDCQLCWYQPPLWENEFPSLIIRPEGIESPE